MSVSPFERRIVRAGRNIRILGVDDGPSPTARRGRVLVVGAVFTGGHRFEGLLSTRVVADGTNATRQVIDMVAPSKFRDQLHVVMFDGVALGGLNVLDLDRIHRELALPVMTIMRRLPDVEAMLAAIDNVPGAARKKRLLARAGAIEAIEVSYPASADGGKVGRGKLYCQLRGLSREGARLVLQVACTRSKLPEPIRAAHLIAAGVVTGESGRRA